MGNLTTATFLKHLAESNLLDAKRLEQIQRAFPAGNDDAASLAQELVRQGRLTAYQASQLLVGKGKELTVGPFQLLDRLGEGGMGQVYKAQHQKLKRVVALKVIRQDRLSSPHLVKRFLREIQRVAQLQTRKKEVDDLRKDHAEQETIKKARAELERNPHHPAANLVLGKYLCVRKDNWEEGLPLLAKGSDPQLKQAALLESEPKKNPAAYVRLGNAWQQLAQRIDLSAAKVAFLRRARYCYEQVEGQLSDADLVLVQNQIKTLDRLLAAEGASISSQVVPPGQLSCAQQIHNARGFFERGRFADAARTLRSTLETSSDAAGKEKLKPYVRFAEKMTQAQGAAQRGKYADATQLFAEAAGQAPDPDSGKVAQYLKFMAQGWRAVQTGNQPEALTAFEAARKVLPSIQLRNTLRCSCQ